MLDWLVNALGCGTPDASDDAPSADAPPKVMVNELFIGPQAQRLFHTLKRY